MSEEQLICDRHFDLNLINKFASLMTLGNGYLGIRGTYEEDYAQQTRGMYIAGIFNKATPNEPSELVNLPDLAGIRIEINGEIFSLLNGEVLTYQRALDMAKGELKREVLWKNKHGERYRLVFQRLVAKNDLHLLALKVTVTSLDRDARIKFVTGINAQQNNFGRQHLIEDRVGIFDEEVMQGIYRTTESNHTIAIATKCTCNGPREITFAAKNRQLLATISQDPAVGQPVVLEKIAAVYTSLDQGEEGQDPGTAGLNKLRTQAGYGYDELLEMSARKWQAFWQQARVRIGSNNQFDQTALDFALYHLEIMTPAHDERMSIGAKGLTGEGYKGHVFWDAEIFILPFHLGTRPQIARNLLRYRYVNLPQAQEKAAANGYEGALFPWESAFAGKEETPEFAAINIKTGKRQKVASALAEHHIVADIAYAVLQYYQTTGDEEFMQNEGLVLLKETARFWLSRVVEENGALSIKNVIGPDEYKEHIDNNAYTNYMAHYNVEQAFHFMLKYQDPDEALLSRGREFLNRLYLPQPNEDQIIPQDDTFLGKPELDLSRYKANPGSQSILLDYSRLEVNEMQILKQADTVMLFYLFPDLFPRDIVLKNLKYYEERTIHDSSLSKAIHAIVGARCGESDLAMRFFRDACLIDLGPNPDSSDEGIHAASLGALWLAAIYGFANISVKPDRLKINPVLPMEWTSLVFPLHLLGCQLKVDVSHERIAVTKYSGPALLIEINGVEYSLVDKVTVNFQ